jgi:CubicO group peptidase (beta-lactamase class C family)
MAYLTWSKPVKQLHSIILWVALSVIGNAAIARETLQVAAAAPSLAPPALTVDAAASAKAAAPPGVAAAPSGQRDLNKEDLNAWLDGYLPYALSVGDIPGAVVVVVKDGSILSARGFGYADVAKRVRVDPERTLFRPGSVSKLVTWTAVMQLVEQKKLDLDTDVNQYLDFRIAPHAGMPITLRDIMTHTAGFEEAAKNIIAYPPTAAPGLGALLKAWTPARIFAAGSTPAYSNYATALAGYIVERQSGQPFDDYVEKHIFQPLGMRSASFRQPLPATLAPLLAKGYEKGGKESEGFEIVGPAPAGSLTASGADMARFMLAHLQNGELDGQRILAPATVAAMHDSALDKINPLSLIAPLNRMELGFFETNTNGREVIGHLGDTEAFHTSLHLFLKDGVGLYVSFNSAGTAGAAGTLRTALFHDFADRYFPDTSATAARVDDATSAAHARMMSGLWQNSRHSESSFFSILGLFGQTKVEVGDKGQLVVPALLGPNGRPREWIEVAPFLWRDANGHDRLAARVVDGKVVRWSMDFMSPFMMFDPVPADKSAAWITPLLYASLGVLLLTCLARPLGWINRRKYRVALDAPLGSRRAIAATQIAASMSLAVLAGWAGVFTAMLSSIKHATSSMDPYLWLLQIAGLIVFVGAVLVSARNAQLALTDGRRWPRKVWSVLVLAATLTVLYVAVRFGLLAMTVNY